MGILSRLFDVLNPTVTALTTPVQTEGPAEEAPIVVAKVGIDFADAVDLIGTITGHAIDRLEYIEKVAENYSRLTTVALAKEGPEAVSDSLLSRRFAPLIAMKRKILMEWQLIHKDLMEAGVKDSVAYYYSYYPETGWDEPIDVLTSQYKYTLGMLNKIDERRGKTGDIPISRKPPTEEETDWVIRQEGVGLQPWERAAFNSEYLAAVMSYEFKGIPYPPNATAAKWKAHLMSDEYLTYHYQKEKNKYFSRTKPFAEIPQGRSEQMQFARSMHLAALIVKWYQDAWALWAPYREEQKKWEDANAGNYIPHEERVAWDLKMDIIEGATNAQIMELVKSTFSYFLRGESSSEVPYLEFPAGSTVTPRAAAANGYPASYSVVMPCALQGIDGARHVTNYVWGVSSATGSRIPGAISFGFPGSADIQLLESVSDPFTGVVYCCFADKSSQYINYASSGGFFANYDAVNQTVSCTIYRALKYIARPVTIDAGGPSQAGSSYAVKLIPGVTPGYSTTELVDLARAKKADLGISIDDLGYPSVPYPYAEIKNITPSDVEGPDKDTNREPLLREPGDNLPVVPPQGEWRFNASKAAGYKNMVGACEQALRRMEQHTQAVQNKKGLAEANHYMRIYLGDYQTGAIDAFVSTALSLPAAIAGAIASRVTVAGPQGWLVAQAIMAGTEALMGKVDRNAAEEEAKDFFRAAVPADALNPYVPFPKAGTAEREQWKLISSRSVDNSKQDVFFTYEQAGQTLYFYYNYVRNTQSYGLLSEYFRLQFEGNKDGLVNGKSDEIVEDEGDPSYDIVYDWANDPNSNISNTGSENNGLWFLSTADTPNSNLAGSNMGAGMFVKGPLYDVETHKFSPAVRYVGVRRGQNIQEAPWLYLQDIYGTVKLFKNDRNAWGTLIVIKKGAPVIGYPKAPPVPKAPGSLYEDSSSSKTAGTSTPPSDPTKPLPSVQLSWTPPT